MEPKTRLALGYVGIGVAAALLAGAAVWAIMSAQLSEAEKAQQITQEQVTTLEAEVASLSAEVEAAAAYSSTGSSESPATQLASAEPSAAELTQPATSERQFCFMRTGTWEGATPQLTVDYAQLLSGDEAAAAATARGSESPPPNDYFIVNDNNKLRTIAANPKIKVTVTSMAEGIEPAGYQMPFGEWYDVLIGMSSNNFVKDGPYWITIKGGVIVAIEEQFLP